MAKGARYSDEFRSSSVELYLKSGESVLKISKDLGVSDVTLSKWVMDYKEKHNEPTAQPKRFIKISLFCLL